MIEACLASKEEVRNVSKDRASGDLVLQSRVRFLSAASNDTLAAFSLWLSAAHISRGGSRAATLTQAL